MCGNGSVPPPKAYMPLIPSIGPKTQEPDYSSRGARRGFANPLLLLLYPDVVLVLLFNGLVYSEFYAITATISTLFQTTYPFLGETNIGLCFLANGGGMLVGGIVTGKLLDADYRRIKRRTLQKLDSKNAEKLLDEDEDAVAKDEHFPLEYARLRTMPAYFAIFVVVAIGYGWCLQAKVSLAGPLVLQVISKSMLVLCSTLDDLAKYVHCPSSRLGDGGHDEQCPNAHHRPCPRARLGHHSMRTCATYGLSMPYTVLVQHANHLSHHRTISSGARSAP